MLNHLKSFHRLVTLAMGNIESDCIIGRGTRGMGDSHTTEATHASFSKCSNPLPTTSPIRHTQLLGKPRGHLSPPRYLWLHCPCLSPCLMQSTALTTANSSGNQDPAGPLSPQILATSLWTVGSDEPQLLGSLGLRNPGRGVCASLCEQLPWVLRTSSLQQGTGAQEAAPEALCQPQTPTSLPHRSSRVSLK